MPRVTNRSFDPTLPVSERYDYARFSKIAGSFMQPDDNESYRVGYRRLIDDKLRRRAFWLVLVNVLIESTFIAWLLWPGHFPFYPNNLFHQICNAVLYGAVALIEILRLLNTISLCLATLRAREPVPVRPTGQHRVALITTIVPSKEPIDVIRRTLMAMKRVRYPGVLDVWLLDEGDDEAVKAVCRELKVKHFSRRGVDRWNQPVGAFRSKTKHGNLNAWLDAHGDDYDIVTSVDPDHAPLPNYARRLLGYFRDPDVAFVVGPQVYGNFDNFVTKSAESQAYVFQAVIQRAGNAYNAAMFVGTNNAFRVSTWRQVGGFQDSITEDLRTSLAVLSSRNPDTKARWKGIYTPDVIAVGEGPSSWTDFFSQQLRWSRGAGEILLHYYWRYFWRLSAGQKLHYTLMLICYPSFASAWVLGALIGILYLIFGADGPQVSLKLWMALYVDAGVAQFALYSWLRRYNVSPHEEHGSLGVRGIFITVVSAPIYVAAWFSSLSGRQAKFVVTPKGDSSSPDHLGTFSRHVMWAVIFELPIAFGFALGHYFSAVLFWSTVSFLVCLTPVTAWLVTRHPLRRQAQEEAGEAALAFQPSINNLPETK